MRTTLTLSLSLVLSFATNAQWVDIPDPNVLGFGQSDVFYFIDDQVGFAAVNGCRIARTADGGQTWTVVGDYDPGQSFGVLGDIGFDATGMFGVAIGFSGFNTDLIGLLSYDGGLTWQNAPDLTSLPPAANTLAVVAPDTFLINSLTSWSLTTDGGNTWEQNHFTATPFLQYLNAQEVVRAGNSIFAEFQSSTDGGANWVDHDLPGIVSINALAQGDALHGLMVQVVEDQPDRLLRTTDGGDTWQPVLYSPTATVRMKHPSLSPDGNGIVVTSNDDTLHVYLSSDYGATWSEHTPSEPNIIATQALLHGAFYAVGNSAGENYLRYSGPVGIPVHAAPALWTYDLNTATLTYHGAERVSFHLYNASGQVVARGVARTEVPFTLDVPTGLYTLSTVGTSVSSMRLFVR